MKLVDKENKAEAQDGNIRPGEIVIGTIVSLDEIGRPVVDFDGNGESEPLIAISTIEIHRSHVGRQAALLFANGQVRSPVIMGLIHNPLASILDNHMHSSPEQAVVAEVEVPLANSLDDVTIDGKKVTIEGKEEIVLKCGEASITLTKAGKIIIRGKYLLSRSSGVNRIFGGSVQIN